MRGGAPRIRCIGPISNLFRLIVRIGLISIGRLYGHSNTELSVGRSEPQSIGILSVLVLAGVVVGSPAVVAKLLYIVGIELLKVWEFLFEVGLVKLSLIH